MMIRSESGHIFFIRYRFKTKNTGRNLPVFKIRNMAHPELSAPG